MNLDDRDGVQLDVVLPAQFFHHTGQLPPEYCLLVAVLVEALNNLRHKKLRASAEEWVASSDTSWPCTFESICDTLGLNANALRIRLIEQSDWRIRRPRQNTSHVGKLRRKRRAA